MNQISSLQFCACANPFVLYCCKNEENRCSSVLEMVIEEQNKSTGNSRAPEAEYDAKDLEVGGVVVYPDRAEVKRMIRVSLKKGENDVMINQLPSVIDSKSLRLGIMHNTRPYVVNGPVGQVLARPLFL